MLKNVLFLLLLFSFPLAAIESLDGFLVTAYDDRFKVISPTQFKPTMEIIVENKTLVRLVGKLIVNNEKTTSFLSINPDKYQKLTVKLKKGDILHFIPLSPAFQEIELIVGNKVYEIPPKK